MNSAASQYARIAPRLFAEHVHPIYVYHLLSGLREAWANGRRFYWGWGPVVDLCECVVSSADYVLPPDYTDTEREMACRMARGAVSDLFWTALAKHEGDHYLPKKYMRRCRDIILRQLDDPDPAPEQEAKYGTGFMSGPNYAINTVRGKAMKALIRYALRYARLEKQRVGTREEGPFPSGERMEPEVKSALTRKLDKREDPSPAIHSLFGQFLANLYYLDQGWVRTHLADIFPPEEDKRQYWEAAWDAYVTWNRLFNEIYRLLETQYRRAIMELPDLADQRQRAGNSLAVHVLTAYLRGLEDWTHEASLLNLFYQNAPSESRKHATWFLWRVLEAEAPSEHDELWHRLRALWEIRVNTASESDDPSAFDEELSEFALWLGSVPEGLDTLEPLVRPIIAHLRIGREGRELIDYLAKQGQGHPALAAELLLEIFTEVVDRLALIGAQDAIRQVLSTAMSSGDRHARLKASTLINLLGERGDYRYRDLLI